MLTYNTLNLMKHLDKTHSEQWAMAIFFQVITDVTGQIRSALAFEAHTPLSSDDERRHVPHVISEMLAINKSFHNFLHRNDVYWS